VSQNHTLNSLAFKSIATCERALLTIPYIFWQPSICVDWRECKLVWMIY